MNKEKPIVVCILCGCEKKYKSKNPYPCSERKTHEWRFKKKLSKCKTKEDIDKVFEENKPKLEAPIGFVKELLKDLQQE